jgi:hypothetical protein
VGSVDGASWNNKRPAGVARGFQVKEHSIECQVDDASNVFADEYSGSFLLNKARQDRPEVAVVFLRKLAACDGERLAREATGPQLCVVGDSSETGGKSKAADAGEEMALAVSSQASRGNVFNATVINISGRDVPGSNKISQPMDAVRIDLVIICRHVSSVIRCRECDTPRFTLATFISNKISLARMA